MEWSIVRCAIDLVGNWRHACLVWGQHAHAGGVNPPVKL